MVIVTLQIIILLYFNLFSHSQSPKTNKNQNKNQWKSKLKLMKNQPQLIKQNTQINHQFKPKSSQS